MKKRHSFLLCLLFASVLVVFALFSRGRTILDVRTKKDLVYSQISFVDGQYLMNRNREVPFETLEQVEEALSEIGESRRLVDHFRELKPLRFRSNPLRIWSVGPDRVDDEGFKIYDPTNGLFSKGDILVYPNPVMRNTGLQ